MDISKNYLLSSSFTLVCVRLWLKNFFLSAEFRSAIWKILAVVALPMISALAAQPRDELVFSGPPAVVSFPLIHMIETGALEDYVKSVRWETWTNPDQMRVAVLRGKADFAAMPSNVVANLYNRGAPVEWVTVSTWGILWMVSRSENLETLSDFRGEEIALPFRGDMPDLVFQAVAREAGLDPERDFRLRYVATPLDAVQLLLTRRVEHALLAEPAISILLERVNSGVARHLAPDLHRSVSLQEEWGRVFHREARMPQAGIAAIGKQSPTLRQAVHRAYTESLQWCLAHPEEAGQIVARHLKQVSPEAAARALEVSPMEALTAAEAEEELRFFYQVLQKANPAIVGGKMPPDDFFRGDVGDEEISGGEKRAREKG